MWLPAGSKILRLKCFFSQSPQSETQSETQVKGLGALLSLPHWVAEIPSNSAPIQPVKKLMFQIKNRCPWNHVTRIYWKHILDVTNIKLSQSCCRFKIRDKGTLLCSVKH